MTTDIDRAAPVGAVLSHRATDDASSLCDAAIAYARRGWPVLPLGPRTKRPISAHGLHDATTDTDQIARWWTNHPTANVGIRTGVACDVVDIDDPGAFAAARSRHGGITIPDGPVAYTAHGLHYYVAVSGAGNRARCVPGTDYRGADGYVVAPPSVHPSGAVYAWDAWAGQDEPLWPLPDWLADAVHARISATHPAPAARARSRYAQTALDAACGRVATAPDGARNDATNRAAYSLGQLVGAGALDAHDVADHLYTAASRAGLDAREITRTIASGLRAGMAQSRRVA